MYDTSAPTHPTETLIAGPRGRRFLLEYALASESTYRPVRDEGSFGFAVAHAAHALTPRKRRGMTFVGSNARESKIVDMTVGEVAARLNHVELHASHASIRLALALATDRGKYWEHPDGEDLLAATPELHRALRRVAVYITASGLTSWWYTPIAKGRQQVVTWNGVFPPLPRENRSIVPQVNAMQRGLDFPSTPRPVPSSTRSLADGSPAGLWFVEDNLGQTRAESTGLIAPDEAQVFEITSSADWAELCVRYPLEVTQTGGAGASRSVVRDAANRVLVPDWLRVADQYQGVHLQVGAYLAASALPIDTGSALSIMTGWDPDETIWLSPEVSYSGERTQWALKEDGFNMVWAKSS